MELLSEPGFLYLIGLLWIINGTVFSVGMLSVEPGSDQTFTGVCMGASWVIGVVHILVSFFV